MKSNSTHFSTALDSSLRAANSNQSLLAKAVGLDASQVSRYCRGQSLPEIDSLNNILGQFQTEHQLTLIAAYLQDQVPPRATDLVYVKRLKSKIEARVGRERDLELPEDIRSALSRLKAKALASPAVRKMLLLLAETLG